MASFSRNVARAPVDQRGHWPSKRILTLQRISEAVCDRDRRIRITFADGYIGVVDLDPLIQKGGVFVALSDPEMCRHVEIEEAAGFSSGRGISTSARTRCGSRRSRGSRTRFDVWSEAGRP